MTKPFGTQSQQKLQDVHPDLVKLITAVNESFQCTIFTGSRTKGQQADFVNGTNASGINPERKILSKTMDSKHLIQLDGYSHAIDVGPDPVDWERGSYKLDLIYFAGYVMHKAQVMKEAGEIVSNIRYGGDWNRNKEISDESFQDLDHFEIDNA